MDHMVKGWIILEVMSAIDYKAAMEDTRNFIKQLKGSTPFKLHCFGQNEDHMTDALEKLQPDCVGMLFMVEVKFSVPMEIVKDEKTSS